jgi:CelD/BcsL family acetyltransferase involved in cellulose biosynthesis
LAALQAYLVGYGGVVHAAQLKTPGSAADALADRLQRDGWTQFRRSAGVCRFIQLTGHTWQSYLASLGSEHRYNFHRRLKQAHKSFDVHFEQARSSLQSREALNTLIRLHNLRWQGHGGSDAFHSPAVVAFHHEMIHRALDQNWLRLFVLRFDDEPVAALYGFVYERVFSFYQSGYDPRFRKHSVGLLLMGLAIKSAIEEGVDEFDMLHGDESYKSHWAKETRHLERLEIYPADVRGRIAMQTRAADRLARGMARRILPEAIADRITAARRLGLWKGLYRAWAP